MKIGHTSANRAQTVNIQTLWASSVLKCYLQIWCMRKDNRIENINV